MLVEAQHQWFIYLQANKNARRIHCLVWMHRSIRHRNVCSRAHHQAHTWPLFFRSTSSWNETPRPPPTVGKISGRPRPQLLFFVLFVFRRAANYTRATPAPRYFICDYFSIPLSVSELKERAVNIYLVQYSRGRSDHPSPPHDVYTTLADVCGSFLSESFFFQTFDIKFYLFCAIFQSSIFSCIFFPNIGMLTNLIFLILLEKFTNSDRTPPYIDTYLQLIPNLGIFGKTRSPIRMNLCTGFAFAREEFVTGMYVCMCDLLLPRLYSRRIVQRRA